MEYPTLSIIKPGALISPTTLNKMKITKAARLVEGKNLIAETETDLFIEINYYRFNTSIKINSAKNNFEYFANNPDLDYEEITPASFLRMYKLINAIINNLNLE